GLEAEQFLGPTRIHASSWLSIRLRGVSDDLARESRQLRDALDQVPDGDLEPGAEIHRVALIVPLGRQQNALGSILDAEEFASRGARSPDNDLRSLGSPLGVQALADQRRNDVRAFEIKVVPRPIKIHGEQDDRIEVVLLTISL